MISEITQTVPIVKMKDGSIRVKGSRLLIDTIIDAHNRGDIPEQIYKSYPSDAYQVADIYAIIAYYLSNKTKFDRYLAEREKEAEKVWNKIESEPKYQARIEEFKIKRQEKLD